MARVGIVAIIIMAALLGLYLIKGNKPEIATASPSPIVLVPPTSPFDFGNQTLFLDETKMSFSKGSYSVNDPDAGLHTAKIDHQTINPAGNRAAAILADQPGGSGTFYYLVGAMLKDGKEIYTIPVLLGDRIMVQKITVDDPEEHDNGQITVEYLDRGPKEPMSATPTKQMIKKYSFEDSGELIEVLH